MNFELNINGSAKSILDFIFPPKCILCSQVDHSSSYPFLCSKCKSEFKPIREPFCTICGMPFLSVHTENHICSACLKEKPRFKILRSAGIYGGTLESAIKAFKYGKRRFLHKPLADFILEICSASLHDLEFDLIVPVPISKRKLRERGFNQAYLLASRIAFTLGKTVDWQNLVKAKETHPQVEMELRKRKLNVEDSFIIKEPQLYKGKKVLLIDDVCTSGSTLNECSRILKRQGGVKKIYCLTLARTLINY